ncbi:hypothetical protein FEM48_Zijuj05G0097500 [Ziziphus jujuba var. spinosa]|uniref:Uncharacterized protein n=1 Tax=Ziziphus jujuba var. spinosa TaxID=714518 RepID=A0A978VE89_ZIZJJ|nr:hypothetical protein FEM48_Zijuj05G0097500 [Ziziphus jujuba var. spinosa]
MCLYAESSTSLHHTNNPTGAIANSNQNAGILKKLQPLCNTGEPRTDFCEIKMDVWIDGNHPQFSLCHLKQIRIPALSNRMLEKKTQML